MSSSRNILTLNEKIKIINAFNNEKQSVRDLAKRFNISKTQAATIIKKRSDLMLKWQSGVNTKQKKDFLKGKVLELDRLCFEWFLKARNKNIPVSGPILKSKAIEIAEKLHYENFNASDGWLQRFRQRHSITFKCISGEAASVNQDDVREFVEKLPSILLEYSPENIYNADETGLFYKALPDKTLALKTEKCIGGKMAKDRLTILFCASMTGSKEPLLVIGKSKRPRAFKQLGKRSLPVTWFANKKAWMTNEIMTQWLIEFDRKIGKFIFYLCKYCYID